MYDVVTFHESRIRLSPQDLERLEQTDSRDVKAGGAKPNAAIATARLGPRVV